MKIHKLQKQHSLTIPDKVQGGLEKHKLGPLAYEEAPLPVEDFNLLDSHLCESVSALIDGFKFKAPPLPRDVPGQGWSVSHNGKPFKPCEPPSNQQGIVDTETVGLHQSIPMMAVLITKSSVFVWKQSVPCFDPHNIDSRIPIGDNNVLGGWNVCFDRSQFTTPFNVSGDTNRWFDFLSINQAVNGFSNQQRGAVGKIVADPQSVFNPSWAEAVTGGNGLSRVAEYYGIPMDKGHRDVIVEAGYAAFKGRLGHESLVYCYNDVVATLKVGQALLIAAGNWSPVIFLGLMSRAGETIPLSEDFASFYDRNEAAYEGVLQRVSDSLISHAEKILDIPESERSLQQRQLDWTLLKGGKYKGQPKWFRDICNKPTIGVRIVPYILGVEYRGLPLIYEDGHWKYGSSFVPHPETGKQISSAFVKKAVYTVKSEETALLLEDIQSLVNWKGTRKSIEKLTYIRRDGFLLQAPRMTPFGTISRRKNDTWMVLPNPKPNRLGTESRMLIQAPPNKCLVTFDVDSEEAIIAAMIADSYLFLQPGMGLQGDEVLPGSSPYAYSCYEGDKDLGTDIHSLIANELEIDRQAGKTLNYAALYGQGLNGVMDSLFRSGLSEMASSTKGRQYVRKMKGNKGLGGMVLGGLASAVFNGLGVLSNAPKSLALGHDIVRSLRACEEFQTTRRNWVIQATGSDILDIITTGLSVLASQAGLKYTVVLTHHDSISICCDPGDSDALARLMVRAHQKAWLMVAETLKLSAIPVSVLTPSSVEIGIQYKHGETPLYKTNYPVRCLSKGDYGSAVAR